MKKTSRILYIIKDIAEAIAYYMTEFTKNWVFPAYHLRNLLFRRYDLVRLPGLKPHRYSDCVERMFLANMALIVEFVENEKPEKYVLWYKGKNGNEGPKYGVPKNTRLYLPEHEGEWIMDIIREIYHWYTEVYPSRQQDHKILLDFWYQVHCGNLMDDGEPDERGLIPCKFDKSECPKTLPEIKALSDVDWMVIDRYLSEDEYLDEQKVRSTLTELENRIFNESQMFLHLYIEVRPYLWT